jgi:hypothetical protein
VGEVAQTMGLKIEARGPLIGSESRTLNIKWIKPLKASKVFKKRLPVPLESGFRYKTNLLT